MWIAATQLWLKKKWMTFKKRNLYGHLEFIMLFISTQLIFGQELVTLVATPQYSKTGHRDSAIAFQSRGSAVKQLGTLVTMFCPWLQQVSGSAGVSVTRSNRAGVSVTCSSRTGVFFARTGIWHEHVVDDILFLTIYSSIRYG